MATREVLVLNEDTPQIEAPQTGDSYLMPVTLDAATGNEAALSLNYTTNKAAGNDTGLLVNQTDTASPGTSLLADFQVGGVSKAKILPTGGIVANNNIASSTAQIILGTNSTATGNVIIDSDGLRIPSNDYYAFSSSTNPSLAADTKLYRDAAGVVRVDDALRVSDTGYTVATLPTGATGTIARVTDATAPSIGSVVAGGGSANALVWFNGTDWTVIGI